MPYPRQLLTGTAVHRALDRIAHQIAERNEHGNQIAIVGIQRGGVHLAERLHKALEKIWHHPLPLGFVDVSMHRDDHSQRLPQNIQPTSIPFDPTGKSVVLVDDVLFSGRTVRAAMDALTDLGRPRAIQLAVLIDRGNRELPIKADFVGKEVPTSLEERIEVSWREDGAEADAVRLIKS
jgi:pyrimidine operon attenuation protein / uracil phosphoribosyltransferase